MPAVQILFIYWRAEERGEEWESQVEIRGGGGSNYINSLAGGTQSVFCSDNLEEEKIRGRYEAETRTQKAVRPPVGVPRRPACAF